MPDLRTIGCEKTLAEALTPSAGTIAVTDDCGRLVGIVCDEHLRDAIFRQATPNTAIADIMDRYPTTLSGHEASPERITARFADEDVPAVVIVDTDGRPTAIIERSHHIPDHSDVDTAILMVGGEGRRLRPLTADVPKPLLPVAGKPILERIVDLLRASGIRTVWMALGYKADQIEAHFGDGARFGVQVCYLREPRPLGTAGAIGTAPVDASKSVVVMNGDILTDLDVRAMIRRHKRDDACLTMAARGYQHRVPYGVLRLLDRRIVSLDEKPVQFFWTNAGIYVVSPRAIARIPKDTYTDMTVLVDGLLRSGEKVSAFPIREYWCDIGLPEDYERANRQWQGR